MPIIVFNEKDLLAAAAANIFAAQGYATMTITRRQPHLPSGGDCVFAFTLTGEDAGRVVVGKHACTSLERIKAGDALPEYVQGVSHVLALHPHGRPSSIKWRKAMVSSAHDFNSRMEAAALQ